MTIEIKINTDPNILRIFIIRHGQTEHNVQKILQGHLDIDMNKTGHNQSQLVGEALKDMQFDGFSTSDLIRCQNTSKEILEHHQNIEVRYTQNLREREMGAVQGMYLKDALAKYGENFRNMGESKEDFLVRVDSEWDRIVKLSETKKYSNYGICTHGGVITAFINYLYDIKKYNLSSSLKPEDLKVPFNTSVSVIDINKQDGRGIIQIFGNTDHLGAQLEVKEQLLR
ncbi:DEHA2G09130p [Debaryomyces hansenii CBS767]|uniref:DEHA2G09130p n=1 Tax=Debaryomyces hansenii (strain ATCC 36239 / CBS 767 / BCRC 21394 / JCM 1990 / NBRC 0083 / IGC 2968) TaxID=284592 RepID=Q6BIM7_DEBHA|nr:DEHA2G09130p [Debaryomyces hansenii CBS767]CAG90412.2 DEHA2G09130p [Debaryomyces hansenii CBS767]|eukprot:XP_461944.2 DEHA2G09130p [Debaryomyces hansenii CBS767]